MWFSSKKQKIAQQDTNKILVDILSNGIELSIDELIQYQSKTSLINLAAAKNLHSKMSGNYLARSKGRGMEFDEVRHYQNGDDIRAIDWRVTARTGKTHTKLFKEEVERPVLIATDLSENMLFGSQLLFKSVQAAHLASLVAWHAKSRGDRVGGIVFNQHFHAELKPRSRLQGVLHYLHILSQVHHKSIQSQTDLTNEEQIHNKRSFEENCGRIRQLAKPGSLVYLITDGFNLTTDSIRHLANITRHCELVVCLITDPLEHELPESENKISVAVTDGQHRQQFTLGDNKMALRYSEQAARLNKNKEELLSKAGARILNFTAGEALEAQLKKGVASWSR
ncbi:MAG: DUF58 domain-containing protein [Colwellia sp.]|nr:DUF58 domain-containing protein [Colwellia sp.]